MIIPTLALILSDSAIATQGWATVYIPGHNLPILLLLCTFCVFFTPADDCSVPGKQTIQRGFDAKIAL